MIDINRQSMAFLYVRSTEPLEAWISYYDPQTRAMKTLMYLQREVRFGGTLRAHNTAVTVSRSAGALWRDLLGGIKWLLADSGMCQRLAGWCLKTHALPLMAATTTAAGLAVPAFMVPDVLVSPPRYQPFLVDLADIFHPFAGAHDAIGVRSIHGGLAALERLTVNLVPEYAATYTVPEVATVDIDAAIAIANDDHPSDEQLRIVAALVWRARAHVARLDRVLGCYFQDETSTLVQFPEPVVWQGTAANPPAHTAAS